MSQFTSALVVSPYQDGKTWYLLSPLMYEVGEEGSNDQVLVHPGFTTDFASIPRLFWIVLPKWGKYGNAAVVHDYLYYDQSRGRSETDRIFFEAMGVLKVSAWQCYPMYWAVRAFGWFAWALNRRKKALGYLKVAAHAPLKAADLPVLWQTQAKDLPRLLLSPSQKPIDIPSNQHEGQKGEKETHKEGIARIGTPAIGPSGTGSLTPGLDKYRELYILAKEAFAEEIARSSKLDEKAAKYLSVWALVFGACAYFAKYAIDKCIPIESPLGLLMLVLTALLLILLAATGWVLFSVVKVSVYAKIPLDLDFFAQNTLIDIFWAMTRGIRMGMLLNRKQGERKVRRLTQAYQLIGFDAILSALVGATYLLHRLEQILAGNP